MGKGHRSQSQAEPAELGRYQLGEKLGEGYGGVVYEAVDRTTGRRVALKRLQRWSTAHDASREFAILSRLRHPCLVRVLDFHYDGVGNPFYTMELLPGAGQEVHGPVSDLSEFLRLAGDLLAGLAYMHAQGVVHADLKPSNIYFPQDTHSPLRLLDFGLALERGETEGTPRGTLVYLAPEVLRGDAPTSSSDLYSLGVVLHELLTGRPVFSGSTEDILRAKLTQTPASVRADRPDVPTEVAEVIQRLLLRAPEGRYRSAFEVLAALAEATGSDRLNAELRGHGYRGRARLVGRESLLHLVESALGWGHQGPTERGALVCFTGDRGIGKSRVISEVAVRARLRGFEVIDLAGLDASAQRLGLAALLGIERPSVTTRGGIQGFDAKLGDALVERSAHRPIVVTIDASGGEDALPEDWLMTLSRASAVAALWVIAEMPADEPPSEGLSIDIPRLSAKAITAFIEASLGPVEGLEELADALAERSAGNPGSLERDLHTLVRTEVLRCRNGRWFGAVDAVVAAPMPAADLDAAAQIVAGLDDAERETLAAAALLAEDASSRHIAQVAGPRAPESLASLTNAGVLNLLDGRYTPRSPALRDAAISSVAAGRLKEMHATILDADLVENPVAVQSHAIGAERPDVVVRMGLEAANAAMARVDFKRAAHCLRAAATARPSCDDTDLPTESELHAHLGDMLARAGDTTAAADSFRAAISLREERSLRLQVKLGKALADGGDHEAALEAFGQTEGCRKCSHCLEHAFAQGWSLTMLGRYDDARDIAIRALGAPIANTDPSGAAQLRYLIGTIAWHAGDTQEACDVLTDTVRDAEDRGDELLLADALKGLGTALRYRGELEAAAAAYARASVQFQRLGLLTEVAKALNNEGVTAYMRGRWAEAQAKWEQFADVVDRLGHSTERVHALNNLGVLYKDRGELEKAVRTFETGRALAQQLKYTRFEAMLHGNLADAQIRRGQFAEARAALDTCERLATQVGAQGELAEATRRRAELLLAQGHPRQALACARAISEEAAGAAGSVEQALLSRVCGLAWMELGDLEDAKGCFATALSILEEQGARYELAQTLIANARLHRLRRNPRASIEDLDKAIQILEPLGARLDLDEARQELTEARQAIQSAGGTAARLRLVLECSRHIARIRQLDPLLHALVDAALDVTGHERGFVVLFDERGAPTIEVGHNFDRKDYDADMAGPSHSIAQRVRETGQPIGSSDLSHDERFASQQSILLGGIRGARCVPITTSEGVIGVVYTDSPFVGDSTEMIQDDLEVLGALADHAGVAIENVRLLEERKDRYELIARTAHEINRPLTPLLYYAHDLLARSGHLPSGDREALEIITAQAERLHRFTRQVLELGRVNGPQLALKLEVVHPDDVVVPALQVLRPLFQARALEMQFTPAADDVAVVVDEDKMVQVISNLVSNAVKFTPRGGTVRVHVRGMEHGASDGPPRWLRRASGEAPVHSNRVVRFEVEDSGPGIPAQEQKSVFDTFVQVHPDARLRAEGAGLGLTICREIVDAHRGRVWVETAPGGGARFVVELAEAVESTKRRRRGRRHPTGEMNRPMAGAGHSSSEV